MQDGMMNVLGLATNVGGRVADVDVNAPVAPIRPSPSDEELVWDDDEERRYREWLHSLDVRRNSTQVDWTELQNEEQYRQKLRDEQEMRENQLIVWDDEREREFRQKYINQRKRQLLEANWDEYQAEEESRERIKRIQEANKNKAIVWDDADERKCQERMRKKYSHH